MNSSAEHCRIIVQKDCQALNLRTACWLQDNVLDSGGGVCEFPTTMHESLFSRSNKDILIIVVFFKGEGAHCERTSARGYNSPSKSGRRFLPSASEPSVDSETELKRDPMARLSRSGPAWITVGISGSF